MPEDTRAIPGIRSEARRRRIRAANALQRTDRRLLVCGSDFPRRFRRAKAAGSPISAKVETFALPDGPARFIGKKQLLRRRALAPMDQEPALRAVQFEIRASQARIPGVVDHFPNHPDPKTVEIEQGEGGLPQSGKRKSLGGKLRRLKRHQVSQLPQQQRIEVFLCGTNDQPDGRVERARQKRRRYIGALVIGQQQHGATLFDAGAFQGFRMAAIADNHLVEKGATLGVPHERRRNVERLEVNADDAGAEFPEKKDALQPQAADAADQKGASRRALRFAFNILHVGHLSCNLTARRAAKYSRDRTRPAGAFCCRPSDGPRFFRGAGGQDLRFPRRAHVT